MESPDATHEIPLGADALGFVNALDRIRTRVLAETPQDPEPATDAA